MDSSDERMKEELQHECYLKDHPSHLIACVQVHDHSEQNLEKDNKFF